MTHSLTGRLRSLATGGALFLLAACGGTEDIDGPLKPIGDFYLGHNIVVAANAQLGPFSREASAEEWEEVLGEEMERRFRRFDGDRMYHLAVSVDGYVLAVPGIPVVAAPRSVIIVGVTVWDDAAGGKINDTPHRMTIFENISGDTMISSGLTQTREEQMRNLSVSAARSIERWLRDNIEWFEGNDPTAPEALARIAAEAEGGTIEAAAVETGAVETGAIGAAPAGTATAAPPG